MSKKCTPCVPMFKRLYLYGYYLKGTLTVVTSEASLVVDLAISSKLINQVHSFLTCLALLGSPCKCCHSQKSSKPRNLIKFQNNNNKNMNNIGNCPSLMTLSPSNSLLSLSNSLVWDLQLRTCQSKPNQLTRSGSLFRLSAYTNCQLCIPCGPNYIQLRLCPQKGQVSSYSFSLEWINAFMARKVRIYLNIAYW